MNRLGLEVTYHGNADLYGEGQWTGTPDTADGHAAPLPIYPQPADLPNPKVEALKDVAAIVAVLALGGVGGWLLRGAPL